MFNPFNYPEIEDLFGNLLEKLLTESNRGAIMIGTAYVDDHLTNFLKEVLPKGKSTGYKNKLFAYPGALSSFSAKIELAYAFRLIDENLYTRLNALRKIRNDAAHSSSDFSLKNIQDRMLEVYSLTPELPDFIKRLATELMMKQKDMAIRKSFEDAGVSYEENAVLIKNRLNSIDLQKKLEDQLPNWELIYGLSMICGYISCERIKISTLLKDKTTWGDFIVQQ